MLNPSAVLIAYGTHSVAVGKHQQLRLPCFLLDHSKRPLVRALDNGLSAGSSLLGVNVAHGRTARETSSSVRRRECVSLLARIKLCTSWFPEPNPRHMKTENENWFDSTQTAMKTRQSPSPSPGQSPIDLATRHPKNRLGVVASNRNKRARRHHRPALTAARHPQRALRQHEHDLAQRRVRPAARSCLPPARWCCRARGSPQIGGTGAPPRRARCAAPRVQHWLAEAPAGGVSSTLQRCTAPTAGAPRPHQQRKVQAAAGDEPHRRQRQSAKAPPRLRRRRAAPRRPQTDKSPARRCGRHSVSARPGAPPRAATGSRTAWRPSPHPPRSSPPQSAGRAGSPRGGDHGGGQATRPDGGGGWQQTLPPPPPPPPPPPLPRPPPARCR